MNDTANSFDGSRQNDSERRNGVCMCGAIRFTVWGDPLRTGLCHCSDCRRFSGSAFTFFGVWPRQAFNCTGEFKTFNGRSFCGNCGSRVFSLRDDEAEIMLGSLEEAPTDLVPDYELWTPRREPWLLQVSWAEQHVGDRPPTDQGDRSCRSSTPSLPSFFPCEFLSAVGSLQFCGEGRAPASCMSTVAELGCSGCHTAVQTLLQERARQPSNGQLAGDAGVSFACRGKGAHR